MPQVNEILKEQVETQNETVESQNESAGPQDSNEQDFQPIFDEIQSMNQVGAINVLIQAAQQAQAAGALTVRDSVVVAQAINILRPGSI